MLISYLHVAYVFVFSLAIVLITILFICPYSPHKARKLGGKKSQRKEPPAKKRKKEDRLWFKVKRGWRDNLYFIYDVLLVTGIKGSLKISWKPVW